jgi:hypothetical protein
MPKLHCKMNIVIVLSVLFLVVATNSFVPDLVDLILMEQIHVKQVTYNRNFDACIALGTNKSLFLSAYTQRLNAVMDVFCNDGSFHSWTAYGSGGGLAFPPLTTLAAVRNL